MFKEKQLTLKTADELSEIVLDLQSQLEKKEGLILTLNRKLTRLLEQLNLMRHERFGKKSEKLPDEPPEANTFDEAIEPENKEEIETADEEITVAEHTRKKKGRKPLPKDLPRIEKIYDLPERSKICGCGAQLSCIGDARSEQLEIIPAKMYVIVHIRKKYACRDCEEGVKQAFFPVQPIPKSIAGPGLLAHILVSKFEDHLPLYRQEKILTRIGVDLPRATLSHWVIRCGELLQPLVELGLEKINQYDVAFADETPLQVLKEVGRRADQKSYMWIFGGAAPEHFFIMYKYAPSRAHEIPREILKDFEGYLHCDGYGGYDKLKKKRPITLVGCWYHARRRFVAASKVSKKPGLANFALKKIARLSKIEKQKATLSAEAMYQLRQEKALPILTELKTWLDEKSPLVPPESLIGNAISYTLNQWPKLMNYLKDGRLEISNNLMERCAKPFATGRKNWLFANSVAGANAAAIIFSLIETCKAHKISPYHWLSYVLRAIPSRHDKASLETLLPFNVKPEELKIVPPPKLN